MVVIKDTVWTETEPDRRAFVATLSPGNQKRLVWAASHQEAFTRAKQVYECNAVLAVEDNVEVVRTALEAVQS